MPQWGPKSRRGRPGYKARPKGSVGAQREVRDLGVARTRRESGATRGQAARGGWLGESGAIRCEGGSQERERERAVALSTVPEAREVPVGKTPVPAQEGQPSGQAPRSPDEKRGKFHSLMGQVLDLRRLRAAYAAVRSHRGEPGVDGVTVEAFGEQLEANLAALVVELRAKTYRPQPVRRVWIPKPDGDQRPLGVPAVRDRVVQRQCCRSWSRSLRRTFRLTVMGFGRGAARSAPCASCTVRCGPATCISWTWTSRSSWTPRHTAPQFMAGRERARDVR
jgi:hypothetical protein